MTKFNKDELMKEIEKLRNDSDFMGRLHKFLHEDERILEGLTNVVCVNCKERVPYAAYHVRGSSKAELSWRCSRTSSAQPQPEKTPRNFVN